MRKSETLILILILTSFLIGILFYPKMPERMASHWNSQGQVDGYMQKFWGLFLLPLVTIGLLLLFTAIHRIDPLKENIELFRRHYDRFVLFTIAFLSSIYLLTILLNIGIKFNMNQLSARANALFQYR